MHYPQDRDVNFFAQLVSERSVRKRIGGKDVRVWEQTPGRANEALDLAVYSYAALCGLMQQGVKLNTLADRMEQNHKPMKMVEQAVEVSGVPKEQFVQPEKKDSVRVRKEFIKGFL